MYISLGHDTVISNSDVVAVCDIDKTTVSKNTKVFLKKAEEKGQIMVATDDIPVSFVVCRDGRVILSQHSTVNILKRLSENK